MRSRSSYVILDVADARQVCAAVFDVLDSCVETARIDAYSDCSDQMPDDIRSAEVWLRERGLLRAERDPAESISIHRGEDIGWSIAQAYALWSTRVTLHDSAGSIVATLDDAARAVTLDLTETQAGALQCKLGASGRLTDVSAS